MKIATFNIRCPWNGDGINSFVHRAGMVWEKISQEMPDIIGFQEIKPKTLAFLEKAFPEYIFIGNYRESEDQIKELYPKTKEGLFTAVKKSSFDVVGHEVFWLSPTPGVPGTRFENQSQYMRICVMTLVKDKQTGKMLRIYNTHLDHIIDEARINGIKCIFDRMSYHNSQFKLPTVLLGDFNAEPTSDSIKFCNEDKTQDLTDVTGQFEITYHSFTDEKPQKIDYIYVSKELLDKVHDTVLWEDELDGIYLSDHFPICTSIDL